MPDRVEGSGGLEDLRALALLALQAKKKVLETAYAQREACDQVITRLEREIRELEEIKDAR